MSGISSHQTATLADTSYKWRERLLIGAAAALVGCRLLSVRHSVAAMVVAVLILTGVFTCYVRGWPWGRRWAFRAALPVAVLANALAFAVGSLVTFLAVSGMLVHNRLGLHVEWNFAFACVPLAALINLFTRGCPPPSRKLRAAAWLANAVLVVYAGWFWRVHESYERFGGEPPFGAELITALAAVSLMALAWGDAAITNSQPGHRRRTRWRAGLVVVTIMAVGLALVRPFQTVIRRCRLEAALTSLGCEVTDRTRRSAPLRIRELAPLRPYVTEIEAIYIPKGCLTAAKCEPLAEILGQVTMLDEIEAPQVPDGCERLLSGLPPGSLMQYVLLSGEGVTDETLAKAGGFRRLYKAALVNAQITDDGLKHLAGLRSLAVLNLRGTPITGSGLTHLAAMPNLLSLVLADTQVDDQHLTLLQPCTGLTDLDVSGTRVTASGVKTLQAALPRCNVKWGPSSPRTP